MASTMAQAEGSSRRTNPRLKGVEVSHVDGQPVKKLVLDIIVNGQEPVKCKSVPETGMIACNILCPTSSTLTINIRKTWKELSRMQTRVRVEARVETVLASINTPLQDEGNTVNVKLFFSGTDADNDARLRQDAAAAKKIAEERPVILDKLEKVRFLVDSIEPIGEAVGDLHPGIKGAFVAVGLLIKVCERQEACREAAVALTDEWDDFLSLTESAPVLREREESRKAVERLLALIDEVSDYIINHTPTGILGGLLSQKYKKKIEDFKSALAKATRSLDLRIDVEELKGIDNLESDKRLDALKPALNAHYRRGEQCLKDTRKRLIGKASVWLHPAEVSPSEAHPRIFWLGGMGGSGKSCVANTVAATVDEDSDLGLSCFFCKRDDEDLSKPEKFFPTLSSNIAKYYPTYRSALVELLNNPKRAAIATDTVEAQFKMLFEDLLPKMKVPVHSHVIVIDALDECGTPADQSKLARCILALAKAAPWMKVFVTSRPVEEIRMCFSHDSMCVLTNINDEGDTDADIRRFIVAELERLKTEKRMKYTLSSKEIDQLVRQAAGLFIWSSTLFKYVGNCSNPWRELRSFLSKGVSKAPLEQLHGLYEEVLNSAVNPKNEYDVAKLHAILGIVYVSAGNRPLPTTALSSFLCADSYFEDEDDGSVRNVTRALHAVLYEDPTSRNAVRVHHPSFLDFLEEKLKDWFSLGIEDVHRLMFRSCLAIMDAELKFNICELEDSTLLNKDVDDLPDRISKSISEALHYGSLFWYPHLSRSGLKRDDEAKSSVSALLCSRKSMFWLEVLSLLGAVGQGAAVLRGCARFFEVSPDIADVASDLERFILSSSEVMKSTPHLYLSALSWVPKETITQSKIAARFKNLDWITRREAKWEGTRWAKSVGEGVSIVACSPDGRLIAAGVWDGTVRILDSDTGDLVGEPFRCSKWIRCLSFSADGERITVVTETITTWNVETGAAVSDPLELEGLDPNEISAAAISLDRSLIACCTYEGAVEFFDAQTGAAFGEPLVKDSISKDAFLKVAFSPDGQLVVSNSSDGALSIWDVKTGTAVGNPLNGHEDFVWSVGFSPDGRCIASGSADKTVRIWSAQTGAALFEPLRGHSSGVTSVAFSPDGRLVASGSNDRTVRIWDTNSGMPVGMPLQGHSDDVHSVVFSPDGRHIVSGSYDGTVRLWDVGFGAAAGDASEGHSSTVYSVSFSPDGERIASGSDDGTVRIWDTKTGAAVGGALEGHEGPVNSVCFSPDGLLLASASNDETIRFWNAITGAAIGEPLRGHTNWITSIAFSPDGQHVVSGSEDKTIRIWDVKTGTAVGNPLEGHEEYIWSVSYSPDGRWIVSGSDDETVRIWNVETGAAFFEPLRGHSDFVRSVAFSPDGKWVASGSGDCTIWIWDANTGAAIGGPLECDSSVWSVAFSPDSRRIVSGSTDIRIWDVETRTEVAEPLRGPSVAVSAVAFSPDGQRIASGSYDDTIRVWDARTAPPERGDGLLAGAHWDACCARMDKDGWVKDGEKLLLWIPHRYRENYRYPRLQLCIRRGALSTVRPAVDLEKLFAYVGTGWTQVCEE